MTIRRFILWSLSAVLALQALVISIISLADRARQHGRPQGCFPHKSSDPITVNDSEARLYAYGEDLYASMLQAIRAAKQRILFETFIWKGDATGEQFKQELLRAAERGVEVYIIFDGFANLVVPRRFKRFPPLLHVLEYPLFSWPWNPLSIKSYARDHRKILVVDGEIAFVGGYNIGSLYATQWRDTHIRITGPEASEIENVFVDFWNAHRKRDQPMLQDQGTRDWDPRISVHRNDPQLVIFPIRTTYLEAIDRAHHHIYMTQAYFIPDGIVLQALCAAAKRSVDVRIILPENSNHVLADWLSHSYYTECLRSGIHLLLYQDAMVHAKTATIDSIWTTIGTANMDRLSLVGNFEVNIEVYHEGLAQQMEAIFHEDATNTRELTLEEWSRRSLPTRFAEMILLPLRPLL